MKLKLCLIALFGCCLSIFSQEYFPKNDGVKSKNSNYTAFKNATIYVSPTKTIKSGTLIVQNGKVHAVGTSVAIPENSVEIDLDGKYIYPSFIDIYSDFGIEKPKPEPRGNRPQYDPSRSGYYWNDHIMPENRAVEKFAFDKKKAEELLKAGFGVVNTHIADGIVRGTGALVSLNEEDADNPRIIAQDVAQYLSFKKSSASRQSYPGSLMGAIALLRQMYHDAEWYEGGNADNKDLSLEALIKNRTLPQIFEAGDKLNDLRADKLGDEFKLNYIIKGGGNEFERIDEIVNTHATYIIPINFPDAYDVSDPYMADKISLGEMRLWNQAPSNPKVLAENDVTFALTTAGLKKVSDFKSNLLRAINYGFDKTKALEALTTIPASLVKKGDRIGTLQKGYLANFLITSGDIFDKKTTLYENWVQGEKYVVNDMNTIDVRGNYTLNVSGETYELSISGSLEKLKSELKKGDTKISSNISYKNGWINLFYTPESSDDKKEFVRLSSAVTTEGNLSGEAVLTNGKASTWTAVKKGKKEDSSKKEDEEKAPKVFPVTYPNKAYGVNTLPQQQTILFKNATVWTSEDAGILENTDVLVKNGKISSIGKDLSGSGATIIDATGKHLTAGIVDEHSHIAAASINESGHNSSAEVSIEDVVNSGDSNIYRNLSGGVTTIQILHGSANPIGGRSAIIKLKWGEDPEDLLLDGRPKFIKFALGENVKQSNWGSRQTIRFPQTRMGVEQVYTDYFQRAKEYDEQWKTYKSNKSKGKTPRYDVELETLAEILNKERFISCHSYVQSEINMMMKVAEKFDFNINTFTHILEGYKVADKMKEHGVGGSTFADWWAYKYEVNDAIPYNAAIMHNQGVTVAINSDDGEMSRRLNQEAAKTVKYGGVSEEEAWKFVTINPAKLLHLDDRIGSIKEGKDADLVLWSDHPLSVYAIAEKTLVEGAIYYDYEKMQQTEKAIQTEKNELINMMISAKNKGMKTQTPKAKKEEEFHCDTMIYGL
ncbi:amidohydrolase family protein [Galbibacter sp. EGI 63066]|uniref:amidohydrolase family protein n=1 Tax=Galbibacter sp. EGI 63066 TaxID=2993559 RepID=UPI002248D5DB|nr:amidohydrolase family protein [Galbibacter sp. EGI 63066]MCX2678503.1 amidohydrolase family protein [Galbibacter sp. EGI 63066]